MEKLIVDPDGKLTIPQEIIKKRGLRPGDELTLIESADGLLVYQGGVDPKSQTWWSSLSDEERRLARAEARRYEDLSEEEQDRLWDEGAESLEAEAEEDEIDLPAK